MHTSAFASGHFHAKAPNGGITAFADLALFTHLQSIHIMLLCLSGLQSHATPPTDRRIWFFAEKPALSSHYRWWFAQRNMVCNTLTHVKPRPWSFATRMPAAQHTTQTYSPITALSPLGAIPFHPCHLASTKLMRYHLLIQLYLGFLAFSNCNIHQGLSAKNKRPQSWWHVSISSFPNCHNLGYTIYPIFGRNHLAFDDYPARFALWWPGWMARVQMVLRGDICNDSMLKPYGKCWSK